MKRKLLVGLFAAALSLSLVACGGDKQTDAPAADNSKQEATMKDGTYEVETKNADDNGGKARASVTIKDGKITEAKYNEFTDKGDKREDKEYNKMMKEKAGTNPSEYEVKIEEGVVKAQSADFDAVTGATNSSAKAKTLFEEALNNAKEGKTDKELVEVK
ncbi:FMN-binding protein [Clostridium sp.]|uniref:FMN-binding protein n=1 Tax=Clostridium sp. TaxID=1506 RepID=UPI0026DC3543|nr:FMN-binding protein [Clostridium sp.]MDO5039105.1 FMN-binding protein [Clostridium sp.]